MSPHWHCLLDRTPDLSGGSGEISQGLSTMPEFGRFLRCATDVIRGYGRDDIIKRSAFISSPIPGKDSLDEFRKSIAMERQSERE
jgi:hypothetical protein